MCKLVGYIKLHLVIIIYTYKYINLISYYVKNTTRLCHMINNFAETFKT